LNTGSAFTDAWRGLLHGFAHGCLSMRFFHARIWAAVTDCWQLDLVGLLSTD